MWKSVPLNKTNGTNGSNGDNTSIKRQFMYLGFPLFMCICWLNIIWKHNKYYSNMSWANVLHCGVMTISCNNGKLVS